MIHHTNIKIMPLSRDEVIKIAQAKPQKIQLQTAVRHEERLRFHTQTILEKRALGRPYRDFINWLGSESPVLLEKGKVDRIDQLIKTPISTVEISDSIFSKLFRAFSSQDPFFDYQFSNDALAQDWESYRSTTFWKTKGFEAMQDAINSVWVIDIPEKQEGDRPKPVNKLVNIKNVVAIDVDENNNCIYVIFREGDLYYAYDDEFIRAYSEKWDLVAEIKHNLEYTPARMMWTDKLESQDTINKESPLTKELADFDWLLFHTASKKYMDIGNAYPILVTYGMEGGYTDNSMGANNAEGSNTEGAISPEGGSGLGAGEHVKVSMPSSKEDPDLMQHPIKFINPEVETLEWHVKEETRLTQKIIKSVVGVEEERRSDAAKNEMQIESGFESQLSVLMRVKRNFEIIQKFADSTICRIRYREEFKGCTIDYGTKFFLMSQEDLFNNYKTAKDSGADDIVLDEITTNILDTRFRDNRAGRTRADIIRDLDPMPEKNIEEVIKIKAVGGMNDIDFAIKMNLLNFVKRFERENLPLHLFGKNLKYRMRLDSINEIFKSYATERLQNQERE